jgi:hypothetical protein
MACRSSDGSGSRARRRRVAMAPPPFGTVEDARAQAKENAVENAQAFRASANLAEYDIYPRGDSSECPNGDGWASIGVWRPYCLSPRARARGAQTVTTLGVASPRP